MNTIRHRCALVLLVVALAGCASTSSESVAAREGRIVETKKIILTGSHIAKDLPKNAIAHPEPPMAPIVITRAGDTMPFMGPGGGPP